MAAQRTACLHVSRAMQAARRRADFDFPRRLGRRAEAGPRQVLRRVSPPLTYEARLFLDFSTAGIASIAERRKLFTDSDEVNTFATSASKTTAVAPLPARREAKRLGRALV